MRKQAQKRGSSVPPVQKLSSLPKEKRNRDEFNQDTAAWLRIKDNRKWRWLLEDIWLGREPRLKWRKELIENVSNDLWELYLRYGILPATVLEMLEKFATAVRSFDWYTWSKLRSSKAREKDAKILEEAGSILEQYWAYLPHVIPKEITKDEQNVYPSSAALDWLARKIRDQFPRQQHRPKNLILILFARALARYFLSLTGRRLYKHVGNLLRRALPERWNPAGNIKEATIKLVNAGNDVKDDLRYIAALIRGDLDYAFSVSDEYWGKKRKRTKRTLKAGMARRPRKARGG